MRGYIVFWLGALRWILYQAPIYVPLSISTGSAEINDLIMVTQKKPRDLEPQEQSERHIRSFFSLQNPRM